MNRLEDYALPLIAGLAAALGDSGSSLLVLAHPAVQTGSEPWLRRLVRSGAVDAVVVTSVVDPRSGASLVAELVEQARGVPVVTLGVAGHGAPDVSCDNASGAAAAAAHLLAAGRHRALVVAGPADNTDSAERERAFTEVFTGARGTVDVVRAGFSREVAYRAVLALLAPSTAGAGAPVDAVFAANDEMALGVLDALSVAGLRCPEDVAVIGFDDTDAAVLARPALTSVDQRLHEQGGRAAALVLAQLALQPVPYRVRTPSQLVARASSTYALPSAPASAEEVDLLRAGRVELLAARALLALQHGVLGAADEGDLARELEALLPRTGLGRVFVTRTRGGAAELVFAWGAPGVVAQGQRHRSEELLPEAHRGELDRGVLVVHQLLRGDQELGLLLYEQEVLDRWTGQALQQGLSSALAVMERTRELAAHAAHLEVLVASRTRQLQQANSGLRAALLVDGLTGVLNRSAFDESLMGAWRAHQLTGQPLSVLMCDVDLFKRYNDAAGHLAGDACLRAVASCISGAVRGRDDVVARFGGEEFAVVLPGTGAAGAAAVAERVLDHLRAAGLPHPGGAPGAVVSLSIGIATSAPPAPAGAPEEVVRRADEALYRAKDEGRDRAVVAGAAEFPQPSG